MSDLHDTVELSPTSKRYAALVGELEADLARERAENDRLRGLLEEKHTRAGGSSAGVLLGVAYLRAVRTIQDIRICLACRSGSSADHTIGLIRGAIREHDEREARR